jgi:uncharacterized protein HemX
MDEFDPRTGPSRPPNDRDPDRAAGISVLASAALLVVALALGFLLWGSAEKQKASGNNEPGVTTGTATSGRNSTGVTPPASR